VLGKLISELKALAKQLPFNLYELSSREEYFLRRMIYLINKLEMDKE